MKQNKKTLKPGLTLIELTVVIVVILALISVLFIGAQAWKRAADASACIVNLRTFQQAARSYSNLTGVADSGVTVANIIAMPVLGGETLLQAAATTTAGTNGQSTGTGANLGTTLNCPSNGDYTEATGTGGTGGTGGATGGGTGATGGGYSSDLGVQFVVCSLATSQGHEPSDQAVASW